MNSKIEHGKYAVILGGLTLVLFSAKPYILDLIEPAKSLGELIGENAKDLIGTLRGEGEIESVNSKRETWSNIITIFSFVLFAGTLIFSTKVFQSDERKLMGIMGGLLAVIGLVMYISHLAIGLIGFAVIAILVVGIVMFEGF